MRLKNRECGPWVLGVWEDGGSCEMAGRAGGRWVMGPPHQASLCSGPLGCGKTMSLLCPVIPGTPRMADKATARGRLPRQGERDLSTEDQKTRAARLSSIRRTRGGIKFTLSRSLEHLY